MNLIHRGKGLWGWQSLNVWGWGGQSLNMGLGGGLRVNPTHMEKGLGGGEGGDVGICVGLGGQSPNCGSMCGVGVGFRAQIGGAEAVSPPPKAAQFGRDAEAALRCRWGPRS